MAPRKSNPAKKGALEGFVAVSSIPPARRSSWASRALDQFLKEDDKILACQFESDKVAIAKQAALTKLAKGDEYAGQIKVHRRGDTVYLEKQ